jgi:hypothetical protein
VSSGILAFFSGDDGFEDRWVDIRGCTTRGEDFVGALAPAVLGRLAMGEDK